MNLFKLSHLRQAQRQVGWRVLMTLILTAILVLGAMFLTDTWLTEISNTNTQAINQFNKVTAVSNIRRLMDGAESAQRGYLLGNKAGYLQPYDGNKQQIQQELTKLSNEMQTAWTTQQEKEWFNQLNSICSARLLEMDMVLNLAKSGQQTEALNLLRTDHGLQLQQQFEQVAGTFENGLRTDLTGVTSQRVEKIKWARLSIIFTILIMSGVILYTIHHLIKVALEKDKAQLQLQQENEIYQQKLAENLHTMQRLVLDAQTDIEESRYQLSRDLHDELGSILTAIKMDLSWSSKQVKENQPEVYEKLQRTMGYLDRAIVFKRQVVEDLHPSMLKNFGLWPAIENLAQETAERNQWQLKLSLPEEELPLTQALQLVIYRVIQESLNNATKYANAQNFTLDIDLQQDMIKIEMIDDGVGMNLSQVKLKAHGISGMKNRIYAAGGKINFESAPGKGMKIQVLLPIFNEMTS